LCVFFFGEDALTPRVAHAHAFPFVSCVQIETVLYGGVFLTSQCQHGSGYSDFPMTIRMHNRSELETTVQAVLSNFTRYQDMMLPMREMYHPQTLNYTSMTTEAIDALRHFGIDQALDDTELAARKPVYQPTECKAATYATFVTSLPKTGTSSLMNIARSMGFVSSKYGQTKFKLQDFMQTMDASKMDPSTILTFNANRKLIASDFPIYALACKLPQLYPKALFIHVERDTSRWVKSVVQQLFCQWMRSSCLQHRMRTHHQVVGFEITKFHFERFSPGIVSDMCEQVREDPSKCDSQNMETWARNLSTVLGQVNTAHNEWVRKCLPIERTLYLRLSDKDAATQIGKFLGCDNTTIKRATKAWGTPRNVFRRPQSITNG